MTSRQLYDLTPQELVDHARMVVEEAEAAVARAVAERTRVGAAGVAMWVDATAMVAVARRAVDEAREAELWMDDQMDYVAAKRAATIANLDILHRQQMMGTWPEHINSAAIREQTSKASVIAEKDEVKKHMGSMLGDWDKAGKLSKRRIRKTKTKTKRRRQKITKRRRK